MATPHPFTDLQQDALCSICQEFYKDPVIIDCGHNFCCACLTKYMEQPDLTISCPECKQKFNKKNLKPNKRLANMVANIQRLEEKFGHLPEGSLCEELGEAGRPPEGSLCGEHGEAARLPEGSLCGEHGEAARLPEGSLCGEHGEAGRPPEGSLCGEHGEAGRLPEGSLCGEHGEAGRLPEGSLCGEHGEAGRPPEGSLCGEHGEAGCLPEGSLCGEHGEVLRLFCDTDETLICLVCRYSREHKEHSVRPIKEAHEDYKDKLYSHMEHLQKELKDLQEWGEEESRKASELEGTIMKQREKILSTFDHLKQLLEKEKQQLLSRLEKEQEEKMKKIQGKLTRLEEQQSTHRSLITELERKLQQQDVDLLKDVKSVLSRCSEVKALKPQEDAPGMEMTLLRIRRHAQLLTELKETFPAEMDWRYVKSCEREVTLDSGTAHPRLIVSADGRSVRRGPRAQDLPDTPQRFTKALCVLGREGLSSGGHYWEVEVGGCPGWTLGVCDESVPRKGLLPLSPARGLWTVRLWDGEYRACTSPRTPLIPRAPPGVLGLFLDYEAGRVSVYDAQDRALLFTFPGASFPRTLRPYFETWNPEGGLRILPGAGGD